MQPDISNELSLLAALCDSLLVLDSHRFIELKDRMTPRGSRNTLRLQLARLQYTLPLTPPQLCTLDMQTGYE